MDQKLPGLKVKLVDTVFESSENKMLPVETAVEDLHSEHQAKLLDIVLPHAYYLIPGMLAFNEGISC